MSLGPAPVLALLIGILHVAIYVLIRGSAGQRLPWLVLASFLGAWAGDALAARLDIGLLRIGDFHVIVASLFAWVGILGVAIVAILGPRPGLESGVGTSAASAGLVVRRRGRQSAVAADVNLSERRAQEVRTEPGSDPVETDQTGKATE
ncbi:MAG: hypothetical protein HYX54_07165 [Chloroflexi bacterium]|nr:hypothetical protein [Chloroflexota bacterium]